MTQLQLEWCQKMQSTDYLQNTTGSLLQTTMKEIKDWVQVKVQIRRGMNNKDQSMMLHLLRFEGGGNYKLLQSELMVVKENLSMIQFGTKTKN